MMMCWFEDEDGVDGEGEEEVGLAVLAVLAVLGWVFSSSSSSSAS
jgi:hypothetical protein